MNNYLNFNCVIHPCLVFKAMAFNKKINDTNCKAGENAGIYPLIRFGAILATSMSL